MVFMHLRKSGGTVIAANDKVAVILIARSCFNEKQNIRSWRAKGKRAMLHSNSFKVSQGDMKIKK